MNRFHRSNFGARWWVGISIVTILAVSARESHAKVTSTTYCLPATDTSALFLLEQSKTYGASAAPQFVALRTALAMPAVPVAQIAPVTTEASCSRAARALDSVNVGLASSPVYLVKVGAQYLTKRQDADVVVQLNNLFTVLNRLAGQ